MQCWLCREVKLKWKKRSRDARTHLDIRGVKPPFTLTRHTPGAPCMLIHFPTDYPTPPGRLRCRARSAQGDGGDFRETATAIIARCHQRRRRCPCPCSCCCSGRCQAPPAGRLPRVRPQRTSCLLPALGPGGIRNSNNKCRHQGHQPRPARRRRAGTPSSPKTSTRSSTSA